MSRQVIDGLIIATVIALGATHLYAQNGANRRVIRPEPVARCSPEKIAAKTDKLAADRGNCEVRP